MSKDCWAKGGGKEGQGPRGRKAKKNEANQAKEINSNLNYACYMAKDFSNYEDTNTKYCEASYMARISKEISKYDWLLDSGTTSHVCTIQEAFIEFHPVNEILNGVGETGPPVTG